MQDFDNKLLIAGSAYQHVNSERGAVSFEGDGAIQTHVFPPFKRISG